MLAEKIDVLLETFLKERTDLFVVKKTVSISNAIEILIDGDNGVSIQDCLDTSRAIENNLDREDEDFSLKVSSYGLGNPLINERQYRKNIGKELEIQTQEKIIKGTLLETDDHKIIINFKERVPKEKGKGKVTIENTIEIPYSEIKIAKNIISFK